MQTRKRRREWIVALTLGILNYTSAVAAETPFSAAELSNQIRDINIQLSTMNTKISTAHYNYRRLEAEIRSIRMDYAPKIHGHPSIRRRIKNALQPQLDQFKRELRALKSESEYRNSQPSKGGETDSTDFRTRLQQLELRIAPLEAEQSTLRELSATRQEVMAYQRVTSQRVEDIQSDLEVNTEKFISFGAKLQSLQNEDKIIVEDVRTALTKLVNDIDGRFEEIVADIPSAPIELDVLELERVNDRIDSLNSSLISMNQKTPKEEKALEAEQVEEIELVTKTYASSSEIEQLESKWTANLRFLAGQFTNLTDSLAADLNYVRMMILMNPPQDVQEEVEGRLTDIDEKLKMLTEKVENNESQLPKEKDSQSEKADELGSSMENITAMARENLLLINLNAMSIEDQKGIIQEHNVAIAKLIDSFTLAGEQLRELSSNATERSMKSNLRITVVEQAMSGTAKQISDLTKEFEKQEKEILASKNGLNNSTSMIETLSESIRNYELLSSSIQKRFNKTQKTIERLVNKQPVVVPQVDQLELTNLSQKFNSLDNHVDEIKKMMKTDHDIVNVLTSNFAQLKKNFTESNSMKDQSFDLQLNGVMDKMREAFTPRIDSCEEQQIILGERLDEVERSRPAESTISKKFNELIKITDEISRTNEEIIQRVDDSERRSSNVEDELKNYLAKEIDVRSRSFEENLNSTRSNLEADISEVRHEMMEKARESDLSALSIKADGIESELEAFRTQLISRRNDISKISSAVQEAKTQTETITFLTDDLASRASKYEHASELLKSSLIDIERKIDDGMASSEDSIEIMSERIDELERTASTTTNLSAKVADIKEEQDKLEGQLIDMSFLIEDDLTTFNNSINVMKTQMSHSLSSKIQYLKESLSGEMSTKMNILSENLRKVNTTSMTASELRSLLETKILQQQVGQKNLEDKLAVIEDHVARVNSRQTTDYENLKTSVSNLDSKLLDASNRAEQALSIVSQKTAEITEKLEMNKELYDRHQESIDRMSSKSVKFEDYLRERKSVVTQIESSLVTLKSDVSGLIDSHAMERKQMMQQRQIIMKLTDNYEDLRIELTELDDDLRPQSEQLFKSIRSVESRVLNLATNVTQVDRTHQNSMNIISGRVAQLQEQINSNMEQTLRGQTENSEYVDKKFGQLLHKVDRQGQRLAASEGKSLEHAKELGFLASDVKKIQEDSTSTLALVFKLANKSNEIEKLTKVNSDELEKRTQILHDKLIVPINHQAGKHSALEQLLVAEIEKIELSVQSILRGEALLNSTVTALGERTRNNEAIFSNSMEANRNFHMSINSRITSIENDFLNLPEKIEDIEDKITQIREENHKIENEVDANSAQTIQNKEIISEITSSVRNWEKATASIGQEIDLVKNEKDKQEQELVETLDKIKEDILMLGIQAKQNEDALKLVDGNVSRNSSIIIDENKQIIQQIAYLTEDMDVFHERLQQLEGVWSTSFETLATQLVASLDDSSDNMSSDSTYDSYTVLDDQDYLDELSIRGDPPTYRRRKRRESPPNNTRKLLDQIHKIAGVFRKYKQTNQAMQQRISSIEDDILNMHNDLGKLQKSVQYTEGKLLENHKQLKLNLENYSKNAASIVEFGHKIEDVKAAQNSQSLKLKTVDNNKDKIYSLEVAIGEQTANFNRRFLEVSESQANLMRKFETSTENFLTNIFTIESSVKYLNETYSRETTWVKERVDKLKKAVDESDQNVDLKLSILENRIKPEILEWKTKHFEILKRLDGDVTAIQKKAGENRKLFDDIIEDYTSIASKTEDMRKKIDSHDDYLTNQGVKIEALTEDSTSLSNDLADIKMTVHENLSNLKLVAGQNKNDLDAMKEKFNSLYKSMETMTNGEEFVAQLAKIERVVSLSNSTVLSSLSDAKQKILELKTEYETDLKKLTNSLSISESKLSASIAQQVKKIELEFIMLNNDVRNQLKTVSESTRAELQKMYQSGDFSRLSTRVLSLENAQLEAREDNQEKLARVDDMMDGHRMMLSRFNGTLSTLTMNKALLNGKLDDFSEGISRLVLALSETTDKQGALTEKVLRMENSFDAFTKSAKTHVHEYLHAKLKTLETKELVIQNEVRKLKELVADAEQELDRVKSLEIVFKENVDSSVRRLRQEFEGLKNARDIADFRLEQKVQDKMDELQKNLNDERGSETLLKIFANRTSILSDDIKTEIQDLQEELSRLESIFMERNDEIKQNTTALARTVQSSIVDAVRRENDVSSKMNSLRSDLDSLTLVATRQAGTYEERLNAAVLKINSLIDTLTQTTSEQSDRLAHTTSEIGQLSAEVEYLKSNTLDKTFWKYDDFETIYKQMKDLATFNVELKLAQLRSAMETKIVATQLALEQDTDEMDEKIDEITEKLSRTARLEEKIQTVQESNDLTSAQLKKMVHEKTEDLIQQQARLVTVVNSLRAKLADTEQDEFARLSSEIDRQARLTIDLNSKVESHNGQFKELEELISSLKSTRSESVANNQIISTIRDLQDDIRSAKVNSTDLRTLLYNLDGDVDKLNRQCSTSFETLRRGVDLFRESISAQLFHVNQTVIRLESGNEDSRTDRIAELNALVTTQGEDCQNRFNRLNDKVISNTNSLENFRREIRSWTTKLISIVDDFDKIGKSISDLFEMRDVLATRVETNEQQITALQSSSKNSMSATDEAIEFDEYVRMDQLLQDLHDLRHDVQATLSTQLDKLSSDFTDLLKESNADAFNNADQIKSEVGRDLQEIKIINNEQIAALTSEFNSKIDSTLKLIESYAKSNGFDDSISDDYDQSETEQGHNLGEKIERMEYQIDQLVNEVDDLTGNITSREYLAEVLDSVTTLKLQVERLETEGKTQIDGIKLEIDKLIPDVMEPIGKLDSRMKNIEHAYKLFNLTNEFSFDSLKEKIKRIDVRVDDLGSQISKVSLGHSGPFFAGASRPGPFDNVESAADEWSSWSKCSVTCGNGIMTRHKKSDVQKKVCNLGSCSCWGEWSAWSPCTKSCGTGITQRTRAILEGMSENDCDGKPEEVAVCGTHNCFGDRVMLLGGRGSFMQHMTIFDASDNSISTDLSALQRSSLRLPKLAMHCTAALDNAVFVIGGYYTRYDVRKVSGSDCHISDPLSVRSEIELMQHQCVEHDGEIWICSAYHKPQRCDSFDGERFTRRTDLDHNHLKGSMVSVPERGLVMIGGAEGSRRTSSSVEILQDGRWRAGPTFPNGGITDSTASVVGGDILVFGGTMESRASDRVYRLAAGSSYWQLMANRLKMPRKQHLSIGIGGSVYLFFGYRETYPIEKWDVIRDESTALSGESSEMWKNRLFASISLLPGDVCLNLN